MVNKKSFIKILCIGKIFYATYPESLHGAKNAKSREFYPVGENKLRLNYLHFDRIAVGGAFPVMVVDGSWMAR